MTASRTARIAIVTAALLAPVVLAVLPSPSDSVGETPRAGSAPVSAPPASTAPPAAGTRKRAAILVFPGVQIIDFTGPYEVLGAAGLKVDTVAERPDAITTAMGLKIIPTYTFATCPRPDVVVVPGGGVESAQDSPAVQKWLRESSEKADVTLSVCNGAFILAKAGLLDGLSATTFAALIDGLKAAAPKTNVVSDRRYVDNGKIVTAAGLSSGIDGALHVVEKLYGKGAAQKVATGLEYNWDRDGKYVRAQLADRYLRRVYQRITDYEREILSHEGTPDLWENRWTVRTDATAADLLSAIKGAVDSKEPPRESAEAGAVKATWSFTDEKGRPWTGVAAVSPVPGQASRYAVSVRVERQGRVS